MSLWKEATYPGDRVRSRMLYRRDARGCIELGEICIQKYDNVVRVACFLPGYETSFPGDTPKMNPEQQMHYRFADPADAKFDEYVAEAYEEGWQNYEPEQHGSLRANGYAIT